MEQLPQSLKEKLNSFMCIVLSKESEWEETKKTCNDYLEKMVELEKSNVELKGKQEELIAEHTNELKKIEKILDALLKENVELKTKLEEERETKEKLVEEYTQMYKKAMGHTELLKKKPVAVNTPTTVEGTGVGKNSTGGGETTKPAAPKRVRFNLNEDDK